MAKVTKSKPAPEVNGVADFDEAPAGPSATQAKLMAGMAAMDNALIERTEEIRLVFTGLVSQENPLLVGPPGTGKSFLLDALIDWMDRSTTPTFTYILQKFVTPEELFGPWNLKRLADGEYVRVTDRKLPVAVLAFIDEVFRGSPAILNTLLKLMNERTFDDGTGPKRTPLRCLVSGANTWPQEEELGALFDRFLLRATVKPIATPEGMEKLWWSDDLKPVMPGKLTVEEIDTAYDEAMALPWTPQAQEAMRKIHAGLAAEGVIVDSDRRWRKCVGVAKAYSYICGGRRVEPEHLESLQWVLWKDPQEQQQKSAKVICRIANPDGVQVAELLSQAASVLKDFAPGNIASVTKTQESLRDIGAKMKHLDEQGKTAGRAAKARTYLRSKYAEITKLSAAAIDRGLASI